MQTVILTGVSGAGKTQALDYLEDFGFYCIDNMPIQLLPKFTELCVEAGQPKMALVTDVRSVVFNRGLPSAEDLTRLKEDGGVTILFLDADDSVLARRYQQSRRRHPLTETCGSLERAIAEERVLLEGMREAADYIIDTSNYKPSDLYDNLRELFENPNHLDEMRFNIISFGFKYGTPRSADFVFDARFLPNPFYIDELKNLSGEDVEVREYVMESETAKEYMKRIEELIDLVIPDYINIDKTHMTIAFGCTGGRHRSVTFAHLLAESLKKKGYEVSLEHRDVKRG